MKKRVLKIVLKSILVIITLLFVNGLFAQGPTNNPKQPSPFWNNVQFGGGIGLGLSSGYTDILFSPSALYNFNPIVALGSGLNLNYVSSNNYFVLF